ncbi:MAG: pyridoxal-phosphate dependent enzyme [Bacteroidota bacterium]
MDQIPQRNTLTEAAARIAPYVHRTPVLTSSAIDALLGAKFFFKCENFQKIGAFKIRGATNAILQIPKADLAKGVCTHSSGNHAQAVALAGRQQGAPAYIVMPENAPEVKKAAVAGYGAEITFCTPTLAARESTTEAVIARTGATFLHPYDNYKIIAGQASATMELLEEQELDWVLTPVGGGGLLAGACLAAKYFAPSTKVYGTEPAGADDAYQSFQTGKHVPSVSPNTIADGLLTSVGKRNYGILKEELADIVICSEEEIVAAMRLMWERMKIVIEPSAAVPLACIMSGKMDYQGKRIGIVISGGNVDLGKLPF